MDTVAVAGATGNLGGRIAGALVRRGARVRSLVRPESAPEKLAALREAGAELVPADFTNAAALSRALEGVSCAVSALQGLSDVLVELQTQLLEAAVAAGVPRFIPSDYSTDFTQLPAGENRNLDLRRELHTRLDGAAVAATSIMNGAFAEILGYGTPLLDFRARRITYWESADWRLDFTAMDDVAAYTAAAALDPTAPRLMRIAGFQISPRELAELAGELFGGPFELVRGGSREELAALNRRLRAADPGGETELYPAWQQSQYVYGMFTVQHHPLDNDRYPELSWTPAREVLERVAQRA